MPCPHMPTKSATSLERLKPLRFEPCCAAKSAPPSTQAGKRDAAIRQDVFDVIATARSKTALKAGAPTDSATQEVNQLSDFVRKCKAAYSIFFPPQPLSLSPKEEGRNRLRMILVADRCAMNTSRLTEMKTSIVNAVSKYVEIEEDETIEVNVTSDADMGTIYSVAVPVKRVRATARMGIAEESEEPSVSSVEWNAEEWDADPSARFPWGT